MMTNTARLVQKLQRVGTNINAKNAHQSMMLLAAARLLDEIIIEMPPEMSEITKLLTLTREAVEALNENPVTDIAHLIDTINLALNVSVQFISSPNDDRPDLAAEVSASLREALPRSRSAS